MGRVEVKMKCNLYGGGFQHVPGSTLNNYSKKLFWDYNSRKNDITFYVDNAIKYGIHDGWSKKIYGWIVESPVLTQSIINYCIKNYSALKTKYKKIFTHSSVLIEIDPVFFIFAPCSGSWINEKDKKIYKKTKLVSMITSDKSFSCGHKRRLAFQKKYQNNFDTYGRGFNYIPDKIDGLKDYCFSVCIENGVDDYYFTEKILDCFTSGTVPIYYGAKKIGNFFNADGIIYINDHFSFNNLSFEVYENMLGAITENYEISKKFINSEDYIYDILIQEHDEIKK